MVNFNDHHNLTYDAERELDRWINSELSGVHQDLIKAAAGEYYFDEVELITPRTLICNTCFEEMDESEERSEGDDCGEEDCGGTLECKKRLDSRPERRSRCWCTCDVCGVEFNVGDRVDAHPDAHPDVYPSLGWMEAHEGETCPEEDCGGTLEGKKCEGMLETQPDQGFPPMWNTIWRCSSYLARRIERRPTLASNAGFEAYGYDGDVYLGVQGAGYSFMAPHFARLYRAVMDCKLPGDPVYYCETCGHEPDDGEGATSFTREEPPTKVGVCGECGGDLYAKSYETQEQKRMRQRDAAVALLDAMYRDMHPGFHEAIINHRREFGLPVHED